MSVLRLSSCGFATEKNGLVLCCAPHVVISIAGELEYVGVQTRFSRYSAAYLWRMESAFEETYLCSSTVTQRHSDNEQNRLFGIAATATTGIYSTVTASHCDSDSVAQSPSVTQSGTVHPVNCKSKQTSMRPSSKKWPPLQQTNATVWSISGCPWTCQLSITGIVNHIMVANTQQLADKSQAGGHRQLSRVGGLVLAWLISQFRGALRRNEKTSCTSTLTRFIAHLA
ncbi:hypothetical protein BKA83DRAFT_4130344 [Pisolithus microcarpus]|nr:hypothetical protein BKA83DRAFT_4130344 [Pisolithus microcarpus]